MPSLPDVEAAEAELPLDEWIAEIMGALEMHEYKCPSSYRRKPDTQASGEGEGTSGAQGPAEAASDQAGQAVRGEGAESPLKVI